MEMFVLSYVNVLCIYPRLSSSQFCLRAQNGIDKPVGYTHTSLSKSMLMKLYICLEICLFFKIHVNCFIARDDSPGANVISMHAVGEGPGAILLSFELFPFSN